MAASAPAPASVVASIAAIGEINAPSGMVVGSLPVTIVGARTLTSVAAVHRAIVAADNEIHTPGLTVARRARIIVTTKATVATEPQSHVENAATGIRCCSLPETMSGANTLMSATAVQIDATVAAVHVAHDGCELGGGSHPCPGGGHPLERPSAAGGGDVV